MAKKKLLETIKNSPGRFYRLAGDVARDRRFDDRERLDILEAWLEQAEGQLADQIAAVIDELRRRSSSSHAAE